MKKNLASESLEYNCKNKIFCELFPELVEVILIFSRSILFLILIMLYFISEI